jgi:hypothetical protein
MITGYNALSSSFNFIVLFLASMFTGDEQEDIHDRTLELVNQYID